MWLEAAGCQQKATKTIESVLPDFLIALAPMHLCHPLAFHPTAQRITQTLKCSSGQSYCNSPKTPNEIFAFQVDQVKQATRYVEGTQNTLVQKIKDSMRNLHCSTGLQKKKRAIDVVFKSPDTIADEGA